MYTLTIPEMQQFITHIGVEMAEPIMLWGPPGVGKSEGVYQACQKANGLLVDIRLSQYDSVDLRGIPVPSEGLTVWHAPSTLPFKGNANFEEAASKPIFLFLDEINAAAPAVAAVAYQLINDRAVGEHKLMDNVTVIAAGNRESDGGVTNRMPTPLANRFTHIEVDADPDSWCEWAQANGLDPMGIAFIQWQKSKLLVFKREQAIKDKAFATPRTWAKALRYYASTTVPEHIKRAAMQGAIGEGPANEFWGFVDVCKDMPSIEAIERAPDKTPVPDQASVRYATAVAISGTMAPKRVDAFAKYLGRMDPEFSILAWSLAMKRDPTLASERSFLDFTKQYREVLVR